MKLGAMQGGGIMRLIARVVSEKKKKWNMSVE